MELLRRDKGPSLGHMVAYYGSAAFKLAHGINIYDYMNKIDTLEYGRVKATTKNLVQEVGLRQRRCEFAHNYDRAMNWSCSAHSQAFSPCTPGVGVYGS